jgi:hypothetical protein
MDEQPVDVELSEGELDKLFEQWYRKPTWVIAPGEYQVVNREKLLAVIRAHRNLRKNYKAG